MNTLTTPIQIPNITKIRFKRPTFNEEASQLSLAIEILGPLGRVYQPWQPLTITITNGPSTGLRKNETSVSFQDFIEFFDINLPTGFTDAVTSFTGASIGAKIKNLETWAISAGVIPDGIVS